MKSELEYEFIQTDGFKLNKTFFIQLQYTSKALHVIISALGWLDKCGCLVNSHVTFM